MRQIKYRGKSITENKWIYGSLINNVFYYRNDDGETLRPVMYILSTENDYDCWEDMPRIWKIVKYFLIQFVSMLSI